MSGLENFKLHIGDTPGLGQTATDMSGKKMDDAYILSKITHHIKDHCSQESAGLSAFLLVLDSNKCVDVDSLRKYMEHFHPKDFVNNLIVILNRANLQEKDDTALVELQDEFMNILDQEHTVRKETKVAAKNIEGVFFSDLNIDKNYDQPSAEELKMLDDELRRLVKLISEKGAIKYRWTDY